MDFSFFPPEWMDEIASTSEELKTRLDAAPLLSGTVLAARRQTKGRGRMGNGWLSADSGDLTFSFYWQGGAAPAAAGSLPMACALGVRDFLADLGVRSQCKWPNDVMTDQGKICGILAEGKLRADSPFGLVVGIGVNVRSVRGRDRLLGRTTASLEQFAVPERDPVRLLDHVLPKIAHWIAAWERNGFAALSHELDQCLWGRGREVAARVAPAGTVRGTVWGLGSGGELILKQPDGTETPVSSLSALENWPS